MLFNFIYRNFVGYKVNKNLANKLLSFLRLEVSLSSSPNIKLQKILLSSDSDSFWFGTGWHPLAVYREEEEEEEEEEDNHECGFSLLARDRGNSDTNMGTHALKYEI